MITRYRADGEKIRYWQGIENQKEIELEYPFLYDPTQEKPVETPAKTTKKGKK